MNYKYWADFNAQTELKKYGSNSLVLYALQLRFGIEDIESVAAECLTDGYEDKKCDLLYIDENEGVAVIAQAYMKQNPQPGERPKLTKACDLNTAAGWVLGRNIEAVPNILKSAVATLQNAIATDAISSIYFWYSHNCYESKEVSNELKTVETTATALLGQLVPGTSINVYGIEVGNSTLEKWYLNTTNKILVADKITIPLPYGGFEITGEKWKAYQAYISGPQLYYLYKRYGDDLFSANPRRFLGIGKKTNAINLGIKLSAENAAQNFWAYNNGITALVHNYTYEDNQLNIEGISIINGAQTTGSLGNLSGRPNEGLYVSLRVITCTDGPTIDAIISNNNKQNEMMPSDFRSNDQCQSRLRGEFEKYPQLYYSGGQRSNLHPRSREVFDPGIVAQTLLAYNGNPVDAYSSKKDIWDEDKLYASIFNSELSAEHIIFVYSLSKTIDSIKFELQKKKNINQILDNELNQLEFLCKRGSRILLLATIARNLEIIIQKKIVSFSKIHFDDNTIFENCVNWWKPIVSSTLSFHWHLLSALSAGGLDSKEKANTAMTGIGELLSAIITTIEPQIADLKRHIVINP